MAAKSSATLSAEGSGGGALGVGADRQRGSDWPVGSFQQLESARVA